MVQFVVLLYGVSTICVYQILHNYANIEPKMSVDR